MDIYNPTPAHPAEWWRTRDGQRITHGLMVWDYDLNERMVDLHATSWIDPSDEFHKYWDGWFAMVDLHGRPGSTMNGARLWVRHPRTGVRVGENRIDLSSD